MDREQEPDQITAETGATTESTEPGKDWQEVFRESDQEAIGDLNGSYESFVAHLEERGLIKIDGGNISWIGGNKKVVFVGDILGDRSPSGLKVMESMSYLNTEAEKNGGSVVSLAGNHDNMFGAVLGGYSTEFGTPVDEDERIFDYRGNLESAFYANTEFKKLVIEKFKKSYNDQVADISSVIERKKGILEKLEAQGADTGLIEVFEKGIVDAENDLKELMDIYANVTVDDESRFMASLKYLSHGDAIYIGKALVENRQECLTNMKNTESGKARLEAVCSQKIATCIDDTLYTHTNLTTSMVRELIKGNSIHEGIEAVNKLYEKGLRYHILGEGDMSENDIRDFNKLRDMFISTSSKSRINYTEDPSTSVEIKKSLQDSLKGLGINLAIHGHNDEKGETKGTPDLPIVSIDRSVYKGNESYGNNSPKATLTVDRSGTVKSNESGIVIRERKN